MADIQPANTEETAGQLLIETDWSEEWKRVQRSRKHVDCPERWNKRAPSFGGALFSSPYAQQFIELLDLKPGDTVFDMGCGNGAIAIPLAKAGYHVVARDFSEGISYALLLGSLISSSEAETGLFWMWSGPSCFLSSVNGYVREPRELKPGCEGPF